MSEPEDLILEGAHFATKIARNIWQRHTQQSTAITLQHIRTRLEIFAGALFGCSITIAVLEPPAPVTWLGKLAHRKSFRKTPTLCANDGQRVYLPPVINLDSPDQMLRMYRLLAVQQAARVVRQSWRAFGQLRAGLIRDLFLLAEGEAVDLWIAALAPGLVPDINHSRSGALAQLWYPQQSQRHPLESAMHTLLSTDARLRTLGLPEGASPEVCAAWAESMANSLSTGKAYEGLPLVSYWGEFLHPVQLHVSGLPSPQADAVKGQQKRPRVANLRRRPRSRQAKEDEDDPGKGTFVVRADDPQESIEDPFGLQRPADRDQHADPKGLADSLSDLPEARVVRTSEQPSEILSFGDAVSSPENSTEASPASKWGIAYPEWDFRTNQYRTPGAIVRQLDPAPGDASWVLSQLALHGKLVRRVRNRFERLRPRPARFYGQMEGAEIDIAAYVSAAADRLAGRTTDGRCYVATRPARRDLAVALLLDVSASTDSWVSNTRRIIDVEKDAMLIVCEAMEAIGGRYGLFAFSSEGIDRVSVSPLKTFAEPSTLLVRRRIAALDSQGYTRLGAPIRHVTAALCREHAASRLLLLLSDGKPNDIDMYKDRYGIEDTRQAVAEARRQGIVVFCLTVDREAPRYAGHIFGTRGFAVLHRPEQLPNVVVEVLRHVIQTR